MDHDNGWWIFNTLISKINEPILVMTCDNVTDLDLDFMQSEYSRLNAPACMLVGVEPIIGVEGDLIEHKDNLVTNISRNNSGKTYASGIQVINPVACNMLIGTRKFFIDLVDN